MSPQLKTEPIQPLPKILKWNLAVRITFRFCLVYLGLYCLATQIITSLFSATQGADIPDPATLWPLRPVVFWAAAHIFHVRAPLSLDGNSGSGDCMFGWVLTFCLLVIAVLATGIWSLLDRKRENYAGLHRWFRLFVRFALAGQMVNYGVAKVIPLQMLYPSLTRLLQPFGTFSPMGVLWSSIGAAPVYEIFAGCAEVAGGVLLIIPRTTTFGALICLADMIQVFMLNMTYDVPVKLFAFHLILLSCFLLAPDFPRLVSVLFLNRATDPSTQAQLFRSVRANRIALTAQIILGFWLVGMNFYSARGYWNIFGGGRPHSPFYGIWEVRRMSTDEQTRPPLSSPTPAVGGAPSSISPTRWRFKGRMIRSLITAPSSDSRTELSSSRKGATRTGPQTSLFSTLPEINSSWMARWTIIRFTWTFSGLTATASCW